MLIGVLGSLLIGLVLTIVITYICYIVVIISSSNQYEDDRYGWGTIFTIFKLRKNPQFVNHYLKFYLRINNKSDINIILDPISYVLMIFYTAFKKIGDFAPKTDFFKTYSKVEAEIIMDKLIK